MLDLSMQSVRMIVEKIFATEEVTQTQQVVPNRWNAGAVVGVGGVHLLWG